MQDSTSLGLFLSLSLSLSLCLPYFDHRIAEHILKEQEKGSYRLDDRQSPPSPLSP
jgi:hypothetical protein